jgi:uncharacterized membrane protein
VLNSYNVAHKCLPAIRHTLLRTHKVRFYNLTLLSLLLGKRRFCNELLCWIDKAFQAVTWLRRLVAGFARLKPGFDSRPVHTEFIANEVSLGQTFIQALLLSPISIIPPLLPIHAFIQLPSKMHNLSY